MDAENDSFPKLSSTSANAPETKKSIFGKPLLWIQLVVFLLGFGLLFYVTYKAGFNTLTETISRVGWGFLFIVLLNGIRHFMRALCIYLVVPPLHRSFTYFQAVAARLGGEAVSVVTFTGPFLGEATKAALLNKNISLSHGGAAIIVDNILYYISVIIMILSGVAALSFSFGGDNAMKYSLIGITVACSFGLVGLILMLWFRIKPVGFLIRRLAKRNLVPAFLDKRKEHIFRLEENVYHFYLHQRATFFTVFGLNFAAHTLSVVEVFSALKMLEHSTTLTDSFIIESLTKVINLAFSFVPGAVGVYEGGNGIILSTLGFLATTGVALALVRRGAILFWTFTGLAIFLWRTFFTKKPQTVETAVLNAAE